jgi:hypothetical protein
MDALEREARLAGIDASILSLYIHDHYPSFLSTSSYLEDDLTAMDEMDSLSDLFSATASMSALPPQILRPDDPVRHLLHLLPLRTFQNRSVPKPSSPQARDPSPPSSLYAVSRPQSFDVTGKATSYRQAELAAYWAIRADENDFPGTTSSLPSTTIPFGMFLPHSRHCVCPIISDSSS